MAIVTCYQCGQTLDTHGGYREVCIQCSATTVTLLFILIVGNEGKDLYACSVLK